MKTTQTQFRIYRDGQLQKWATYKPQIMPKTVGFIINGQEAVLQLGGQLRGFGRALNEQMDKVANS